MKTQFDRKENRKRIFSALRSQWDKAGEGIDDAQLHDRIWLHIHRSVRSDASRTYWMAAAGIAAVVLMISGLYWSGHGLRMQDGSPADCEWIAENSCRCLLPDSTEVWMEAGSRLRYKDSFSQDRQVWLDGDATFDVTRRSGSTFRVCLDDSYIEVKGTVFSVRQNSGDMVTVSLYEGKVDFVSSVTGECSQLSPSQQVIYSRSEGVMHRKDLPAQIQWSDGHYMLHQVDLPQLTDFLRQHYGVRIESDVADSASLKMTGIISFDEPLSSVLSNICFTLNLNCICKDDTYILKNTNLN